VRLLALGTDDLSLDLRRQLIGEVTTGRAMLDASEADAPPVVIHEGVGGREWESNPRRTARRPLPDLRSVQSCIVQTFAQVPMKCQGARDTTWSPTRTTRIEEP
jgi:hypothetical protein